MKNNDVMKCKKMISQFFFHWTMVGNIVKIIFGGCAFSLI